MYLAKNGMLQDSDSTDEEVYMGKYTLKEAKRDLKKPIVKNVHKRHTIASRYTPAPVEKTINPNDQLEQNTSMSTNPSEYVSPNESISTEELTSNSEFLDKLSKVINEPSNHSSYKTACDETSPLSEEDDNCLKFMRVAEDETNVYLKNIHQTLVENTVIISDDEELNKENVRFEDSFLAVKQRIKEENQYEINESIISISDDSFSVNLQHYDLVKECEENTSKSVFTKAEQKGDKPNQSSIPNKDYQEREHEYENEPPNELRHNNSEEIGQIEKNSLDFKRISLSESDSHEYSFNISDESLNNSGDSNIVEHNQPFVPKDNRKLFSCAQLSKISEKTEYTSCIQNDNSINSEQDVRSTTPMFQNSNSSLMDNKKSRNSSPINVPEINLEQFDDSCNFDDTLEEINKLLQQGIDYTMPDKCATPLKSPPKNLSFSPKDIISGSFFTNQVDISTLFSSSSIDTSKKFYSDEKLAKPSTEVERPKTTGKLKYDKVESRIKPPSVHAMSLFTKHMEKTKTDTDFKVPMKSVKKTPGKVSQPHLKNVISPVGVYIKNSPRYCPMKKVPQNPGLSMGHSKPASKLWRTEHPDIKKNIQSAANTEIPCIIYKPAKGQVATVENEINLPGSIKKLIKEPQVIKHERRINRANFNKSVERRLIESDLSIDSSLSSSSNPDISVLTIKQGFKK